MAATTATSEQAMLSERPVAMASNFSFSNMSTSSSPSTPASTDSLVESSSSASSVDSTPPGIFIGTALVIGGCGFLGHHVVKQLLAEPTCTKVAVMCRSPFKNRFDGVLYHIGDITKPEHVDIVVDQVKPHVVINTASPHAYIDHVNAYENFTVNVDGNRNLLAAMAKVGTVQAYVYTSSGPIIAGSGGDYDHATETHPTLAYPVVRKGDPYHLAKALGDQMVLDANGKNGIRTACVRPTALYGEGDFQMVGPVVKVVEDGQTNVWMGYNDVEMDVVYAGHVAEAEILAIKGLLRGITDSDAPKIDGEAFNVTDDSPCPPWTFFRKYWVLAGDKTPMSSVWMFPPGLVLFMAHFAEWWTWVFSLGKYRPALLKLERMEFALFTRTYSIDKARERLGFKPWVNQPYGNQDDAVKGALEWYLRPENHGPVKIPGVSSWPESPFRLISDTGANTKAGLRKDHYCVKNARIMAMTHNTFFRALNAIYHQAPLIVPGTQDAVDFLAYCGVAYDFIHHHQITEELHYFPEIERVAKIPGLMETNVLQHQLMDAGLEKFRRYAETTHKDAYNGDELRSIIDGFAVAFEEHNHAEIDTILSLHDKIDSDVLKDIEQRMRDLAEKHSDIFKVAPFVLGCQDRSFIIDDEKAHFPLQPFIALVFVHLALAGRHAGLWRFNPSNQYGKPRDPPSPNRSTETKTDSKIETKTEIPRVSYDISYNWSRFIPLFVALLSILSATLLAKY